MSVSVNVFANMIKSRRKELGLTQEQLADILMINRVTLARIEKGQRQFISISNAEIFFKHLGISWIDFALRVQKELK